MQHALKISEASVIALHAMGYMADKKEIVSATAISRVLGVSYDHLAKVLQKLTRAGLVSPARGHMGGFTLSAAGKTSRNFQQRDGSAAPDNYHCAASDADRTSRNFQLSLEQASTEVVFVSCSSAN